MDPARPPLARERAPLREGGGETSHRPTVETMNDVAFTPPPRPVRIAAWAGIGAVLLYAAIKTYWALGGTAGPSGFDTARELEKNGAPARLIWMERHGIDCTPVLAVLGALLLLALIRPWSARLPRAVLVAPAWLGAAVFVPYGFLSAVVAVAGRDADGAPQLTPWMMVAGVVACGVGISLGFCAGSCQTRSWHPSEVRADRHHRP